MAGAVAASVSPVPSTAQSRRTSPADHFVESTGVCTHLSSAPYAERFNEVLRLTRSLGVRHFRDELRPSDDLDRWRTLFRDAGIRAHLLVSPTTNSIPEMLDYLREMPPGSVSAVEGQNEGDSDWFRAQPAAASGWTGAVIDYQRSLFQALRKVYSSATLSILSPTVLDYQPDDMALLNLLAQYCDMVALHAYPQGHQEPETSDDYAALAWYVEKIGNPFKAGAPTMVTETGYDTSRTGISPRAASIYLPRMLLNAYSKGIVRSFIYELFDEGTNPAEPEQRYGLVMVDGTPKPAFQTLKILLSELSDPGPEFVPAPIEVEVGHAPRDLRISRFGKRDGSSYLALWRTARSWDTVALRDVIVQPVDIHLQFKASFGDLAALSLSPQGAWRRMTFPADRRLRIPVSDVVTLIRLRNAVVSNRRRPLVAR